MQCEDIKPLLFEYADDTLSLEQRNLVSAMLETCESCRADYAAILALKSQASVWHDETPGPWQPPQVERQRADWQSGFLQWFPALASTAALAVMLVVHFAPQSDNGVLSTDPLLAEWPADPVSTFQAAEPQLVRSVLESSRTQRQAELETLVRALTAEMDKRSLETEESLRYIVAHQVQEQQELDELRAQVQALLDAQQDGDNSQ